MANEEKLIQRNLDLRVLNLNQDFCKNKQISDVSKSNTGKIMGIIGTKRFINKLKGNFSLKIELLIGKINKKNKKRKIISPLNPINKLPLFKQILFKNTKGRHKNHRNSISSDHLNRLQNVVTIEYHISLDKSTFTYKHVFSRWCLPKTNSH